MELKSISKRFIACLAAVVTVMTVTAGSQPLINTPIAEATSAEAQAKAQEIEDAKAKLQELETRQAELDAQIKATEGDIANEEETQAAIEEQITTVEETLAALENSIVALNQRIAELTESIAAKEADIEVKKQEITQGVEDFKKRIRIMYVAGSESYTDILVGATDFYDMLMKLELVKRVADHDNTTIDNLIELKNQFEADEAALEAEKTELETNKSDLVSQQEKHSEQKDKLEELYLQSKATIERLKADEEAYRANQDANDAEHDAFEAELAQLYAEQEAIKQKEEEERKRKEEEERKRKEEEEAERQRQAAIKAQEEEAARKAPTTPDISGDDDDDDDDSDPPSGDGTAERDSKSMFAWPCPGFYYISYGVGPRWGSYHQGIDIYSSNIRGANICAAADGTVIRVVNGCPHDFGKNYSCGCGGGYGNYCIIDHGDGWWTLYGHSEGITVSVGQTVKQGDVLGTVGSTGHSTGPHLHFEIRLNGVALDPEDYV